jgi:hypothetical protein
MNSITNLTPGQLRQAADIKERIDALQNELNEILGSEVPTPAAITEKPKKRQMSAAGRAAIGAAARARWAKYNAAKGGAKAVEPVKKARKKISAAGIARIRAAQKARWAAIKGTMPAAKPVRKRKLSAAGRAALVAAAKARWAKTKAAGKSKL